LLSFPLIFIKNFFPLNNQNFNLKFRLQFTYIDKWLNLIKA
jgi:hypothetical protein